MGAGFRNNAVPLQFVYLTSTSTSTHNSTDTRYLSPIYVVLLPLVVVYLTSTHNSTDTRYLSPIFITQRYPNQVEKALFSLCRGFLVPNFFKKIK